MTKETVSVSVSHATTWGVSGSDGGLVASVSFAPSDAGDEVIEVSLEGETTPLSVAEAEAFREALGSAISAAKSYVPADRSRTK